MIKRPLLILILCFASFLGYAQSPVTPSFKGVTTGSTHLNSDLYYFFPGKIAGYDTLFNSYALRSYFQQSFQKVTTLDSSNTNYPSTSAVRKYGYANYILNTTVAKNQNFNIGTGTGNARTIKTTETQGAGAGRTITMTGDQISSSLGGVLSYQPGSNVYLVGNQATLVSGTHIIAAGNGSSGPFSFATDLQVYKKPVSGLDVERKRDVDSLLTSYVPSTRTLTIGGTTQDLSANRTFSLGFVSTDGNNLSNARLYNSGLNNLTGTQITYSTNLEPNKPTPVNGFNYHMAVDANTMGDIFLNINNELYTRITTSGGTGYGTPLKLLTALDGQAKGAYWSNDGSNLSVSVVNNGDVNTFLGNQTVYSTTSATGKPTASAGWSQTFGTTTAGFRGQTFLTIDGEFYWHTTVTGDAGYPAWLKAATTADLAAYVPIAGSTNITGTKRFSAASTDFDNLISSSMGGSHRFYNTVDQTTNFERAVLYWDANQFYMATRNGGTGISRDIIISSLGGVVYLEGRMIDLGRSYSSGTSNASFVRQNNTATAVSGVSNFYNMSTTVNQSATAGYNGMLVNVTETATGSGVKRLFAGQIGGVDKFSVSNTGLISGNGLSLTLGSDATNDMFYRNSSGNFARLGIGSSQTILGVNSAGNQYKYWQLYGHDGIKIEVLTGGSQFIFSAYEPFTSTTVNLDLTAPGPEGNQFFTLDVIVANKTITLPNPADYTGKHFKFWNRNTSGFTWTYTGSYLPVNASGSSFSTIASNTVTDIYSTGSDWIKVN